MYLKGHLLFVNQFHSNVVGSVEGQIGTEDVEEIGGDGRLAYCTPQEKSQIQNLAIERVKVLKWKCH